MTRRTYQEDSVHDSKTCDVIRNKSVVCAGERETEYSLHTESGDHGVLLWRFSVLDAIADDHRSDWNDNNRGQIRLRVRNSLWVLDSPQ